MGPLRPAPTPPVLLPRTELTGVDVGGAGGAVAVAVAGICVDVGTGVCVFRVPPPELGGVLVGQGISCSFAPWQGVGVAVAVAVFVAVAVLVGVVVLVGVAVLVFVAVAVGVFVDVRVAVAVAVFVAVAVLVFVGDGPTVSVAVGVLVEVCVAVGVAVFVAVAVGVLVGCVGTVKCSVAGEQGPVTLPVGSAGGAAAGRHLGREGVVSSSPPTRLLIVRMMSVGAVTLSANVSFAATSEPPSTIVWLPMVV